MHEIPQPHRVAKRNPKTGRWEPVFSPDYRGGLDPYGDVPIETRRASTGVEDFRFRFQKIVPLNWSFIPAPVGQEYLGIAVMIDTKDFEGREGVDVAEVSFSAPRREGLQLASLKHRFYLHPNNIGVFKIVHYAITSANEFHEAVLEEHWVTAADFSILREVEKVLAEANEK